MGLVIRPGVEWAGLAAGKTENENVGCSDSSCSRTGEGLDGGNNCVSKLAEPGDREPNCRWRRVRGVPFAIACFLSPLSLRLLVSQSSSDMTGISASPLCGSLVPRGIDVLRSVPFLRFFFVCALEGVDLRVGDSSSLLGSGTRCAWGVPLRRGRVERRNGVRGASVSDS